MPVGAVEFDPQSLKPTFHLKLGEPGNSNALIIAKRLGMPARLVKAAKGFLADSTRALNKAIAGTLDSRREAEQARKAAREAQVDAQRQRDEAERDLACGMGAEWSLLALLITLARRRRRGQGR